MFEPFRIRARLIAITALLQVGLLTTAARLPADEPSAEQALNYARLANASVAAELKLTDEQRTQISALLKQRQEALAAAADADKPKVAQDSDTQLNALLTDEQRAAFPKLRPETKLRFNFRFQKWADVLDWFAEQSDLSLVLDAPPPGTFNYSDNREYTASEAIDLLNGVLQTKGYTLIRRNRMLLVVDVADGLPEGLIPRVTLAELDNRGKFELVSVMFPLEARPAAEVEAEIKPLLGPNGKAIPLPKTKQILVTDMAGVMRAIGAVIKSMPLPKPPAAPPKPVPPPKPLLTIYPVKSVDPAAAIQTLSKLIPGVNVVHDPKADQFNVFAIPAQQAAIKLVLDQLQANTAPEKQPRIELYPVELDDAPQIMESLNLIVPEAQMRVDSKNSAIVAWAAPEHHEKIKQTIEKLSQPGAIQQTRQVEVYRVKKADPNTTLTLLQTLFPRAKLSVDTTSRSIISVAIPDDQKGIKATLDQLQPDKPAADTPEMRFYPFAKPVPGNLVTILQGVATAAQITQDDGGRRLTVLATPADHDLIKSTIERYQKATPPGAPIEKNSLKIYSVTPAQRTRFQAVVDTLSGELPGIRIITDAEPGELAVWAKSKQHAMIAGILDSLKREVPEEERQRLVVYPVQDSNPSSALTMLQNLFPSTRIVLDENTKRLLVWTKPAEHEKIAESLKQITSEKPEAIRPRFEIYAVQGASAPELMATLQPLVPAARLAVDAKTGKLLAWATPEEHAMLKTAVERLQQNDSPQTTQQVEVYRLIKADPNAAMTLLQSLVPNARLSVDTQANSLIAVAVLDDQRIIATTIEQLESDVPNADAPQMQFYPTKKPPAENVLMVLRGLVPNAQVSYDEAGRRLIVVASSKDQETVKSSLERIESTAPGTEPSVLEVYAVTPAQRKRFEAILESITSELPGLRVITDAEPGELSVWAKPAQHAVLAGMLEKLKRDVPDGEKYQLQSYTIKSGDAASAQTVLQELFPGTRIVVDQKSKRLLVWTRPDEHDLIRASVEQINMGISDEMLETFKVYPVSDADPGVAISMLNNLFPEAQFSSDAVARTVLAWAPKRDHETIARTLETMQAASLAKDQRSVVVYPMGKGDSGSLIDMLRELVPSARLDDHRRTRRLVAWATAKEHKTITETLAKVAGDESAQAGENVVVYEVKSASIPTVMQVLQSVAPDARYHPGTDAHKLIVWARAEDHATIKPIIEKLETDAKPDDTRELAVYPLYGATGSTLSQVLSPFQSEGAQIVTDTTRDSLIVRATAEQQAEIKKAIDDLTAKLPKTIRPISKVYRFKQADAYAASSIIPSLVPSARVVVDPRSRTLVVSALPKEHERVQNAVDEMERDAEGAEAQQMKSYRVGTVNVSTLVGILQSLFANFPEVRFAADPPSGTLAAFATPSQHEKIRGVIDEMEKPEKGLTTQVYHFRNALPSSAQTVLQPLVPNARMTVDPRQRTLVATASTADHERIRQTIERLDSDEAGQQAVKLHTYPLTSSDGPTTMSMLQVLFSQHPEVRISWDARNDNIVALASAAQHELIKTSVEEIEHKSKGRTTDVYRLKSADPNAIQSVLSTIAPRAQVAVDQRSRALVVSATPTDHAKIKTTIEQVEAAGEDEQALGLHSYSLSSADPNSAVSALSSLFATRPEVRISLDTRSETIVALATPTQHELIQKSLDELEKQAKGKTSVVYRFKNADPNAAMTVLQTLTPNARMAVDQRQRALVVSASAADHEKIKATVDSMDTNEDGGQAPRLQAYRVESANPTNIQQVLGSLYASHPEVQISADVKNDSVVVLASESQHKTIAELIKQVDKKPAARAASSIEVYVVERGDVEGVLRSLNTLFARQTPTVDLSIGPIGNELIAVAKPEQHALIRQTLERLEGDPAVFEVFQLEVIDPLTAEMAISNLLGSDIYDDDPGAPAVDSDFSTQQLYVRATQKQMDQIRNLLVKMGESGLVKVEPGGNRKTIRVIPFRGDAKAALAEIQRVWPQLRKNSIRVVVPSAVAPLLRQARPKKNDPESAPNDERPDDGDGTDGQDDASQGQFSVSDDEAAEKPVRPAATAETDGAPESNTTKQSDGAASTDKNTPSEDAKIAENSEDDAPAVDADGDDSDTKPAQVPPIIVSTSSDSITIASDDLEALDQLESLLRSMSRRVHGSRGRDYIVFSLKNSSAEQVATQLNQVFRTGSTNTIGSGRVVIVPDDRLNAIIVHANRNDRETIEGLLEVIDAKDPIDSQIANRPVLIPVKNTKAWRVEELIRDLYQTQLTSGGGRQKISIPRGVSRDVASAIQQFNITNTAPLLTVGIDELTNSLVVMAPAVLVEEIKALVERIDLAAAGDTSRNVTIIPLKQANSESVRDALDMILGDERRSRTGGKSRSKSRSRSRSRRAR